MSYWGRISSIRGPRVTMCKPSVVARRLMFDVEEVLLEPVPLGVKASAQVLVINDGYDNLDLKVKMPVDTDKIPISVDFPDGTMIGVAKERLPMVVSFIAYKPTSFTAAIELMDFEGARYRLPISGVSDNSVLSTSDFMTRNAKSLNIARGAGPRDVPKLLLAPGSDETSTSGLANVGPLEVNRFLPRYLNATTMLGPFTNLREDILASKGRTIIDIVEILSGKPVPGKATQLPASRREAMVMLLNQYEKLIQHLASLGALLNTTKPEFLLDADDFARLLSMRETQGGEDTIKDARLGLLFWEQVEANFPAVSTRAWNAVLAQVAKALVLSRCSVRGLKQAGVPVPKEMEKAWATSNVYSVPEMTLLAWVQHWYSKVFPSEPAGKLLRFDTDVNNGKVLYAVLVSHWPSLKAFKDRMLPEEDTSESKLHNAQVVVDMVKQLELPFFFTASELVEASCDEMVLLLVYLFQTLPQLAPKNSITFSARLGEVLTKYVELHNPSSMAVSYYARLEGHSDFALTSTTVFLEPHATVHFPVQCKSSISKPVSGFLVLSSRRDGTGKSRRISLKVHQDSWTSSASCLASAYKTHVILPLLQPTVRHLCLRSSPRSTRACRSRKPRLTELRIRWRSQRLRFETRSPGTATSPSSLSSTCKMVRAALFHVQRPCCHGRSAGTCLLGLACL